MVFSVVLLPAPFDPISVTISPRFDLDGDALERVDVPVERVDILAVPAIFDSVICCPSPSVAS